MATYADFEPNRFCNDHGLPWPNGGFWVGSEIYECAMCRARFAGVECKCELVHECRKVGA